MQPMLAKSCRDICCDIDVNFPMSKESDRLCHATSGYEGRRQMASNHDRELWSRIVSNTFTGNTTLSRLLLAASVDRRLPANALTSPRPLPLPPSSPPTLHMNSNSRSPISMNRTICSIMTYDWYIVNIARSPNACIRVRSCLAR